ncbi:hypothetical protein [Burkholderia sp. Ac-20365]|uniref:hypothetical protein n=1 Tax=Burkholderia sp. Ac-20365 TaxID=2703897 RepID=UPI00197BECC9|nr:hypothetical protein [Burkholderia sp. Ac-20365]MBN3760887.1 hypothetical protein [Burkholderia sp. Ac-20365]
MKARKTALRKVAGALSAATTKQLILASFVTHDDGGDDEIGYHYVDPETRREFHVRRSETLDDCNRPCFRYFLEERIPNGRLAEVDERGICTRAWDAPLIKEVEARVGPNGLIKELVQLGVDVDKMISVGGGYGVGSIFYPSLEESAGAIELALKNNERYQYFRALTDQEKIKLDRRSAVQSHEYWLAQSAAAARSWATQEDLFKGCYDGLDRPLSDDSKKRILSYLNNPGQDVWLEVRSIIVTGHKNLWAVWCQNDLLAPRSGDKGYPSADALRAAIRSSAASRRAEIEEKLKTTSPSGLRSV